jgi:hypothetical protein
VNQSNGEYPPADRGRNLRRHSHWRRVLAWGLAWVVGAQLSAVFYLEWRHPEFLDPKYGCRMLALRERRAAQPKRTLLVVLGSSRAEQGFRPALLAHSTSEQDPFFYNLARGGSSPLLYLLTLRRLLADGIRPDGLLVEIFPPALAEAPIDVTIYKPTLRDLPLLRRYPVSGRTWAFWLQDRLLLWHKYRSGFVAWAAPQLLTPEARWGEHLWDYRGGEWRVLGAGVSPTEHRRLTDDAHRRYASSLQNLHIDPHGDRALRELLDICRTHRIGVVLFLKPEACEFRGWYPPETQGRLTDYLARLRRDYGVPLIDARRWIDDEEFSDAHHLLARGAAMFTRRFAAEVRSAHFRGG